MSIQNYIELCNRYGRYIHDVQGPGGNVSVKAPTDDAPDMLLVKASGTLMKEVSTAMTGAQVKYITLIEFMQKRKELPLTQALENELVAEVKELTCSDLRPSMETAMHALIPRKYIVHTHNVYANIFLTAEEGKEELLKHTSDFGWIPVAVPGMNLAQEIAKAYPVTTPKILFLENHGMVISDDTADALIATYDTLIRALVSFLEEHAISPMPSAYSVIEKTDNEYTIELFPGIASSFADMKYLSEKYIYPDAAVFGQTLDLEKLYLKDNTVTLIGYPKKQATNVLENIAAINYILYAHEKLRRKTKVLPQHIIEYMADMEAEKFRKTLNNSQ